MKTNHRRGYKDDGSFRDPSMMEQSSRISGVKSSIGNDFHKGHRGAARSKAGLKKFIRTRDRKALKDNLKKEIKEL
jgi:hypothetical protein